MDPLNSCRCCLRRPPDRALTTSYTHLGHTEIYSNMLEECFDLNIKVGDGECGICEVCVGRLRDASDFKLQVQRSQAELQRLCSIDVKPVVKKENIDDDNDATNEVTIDVLIEVPIKTESGEELLHEDPLFEEACHGSRTSEVGTRTGWLDSDTTEHWPATRERDDESSASQLFLATLPEPSRASPERPTPILGAEKLYTCDTCKQQFTDKIKLIKHTKKHLIYICAECNKGFRNNSNLTRHKKIHTGEKPYACDKCERRFAENSALTVHKKIHIGKEAYIYNCKDCNKLFKNRSHLNVHKKIHTGLKPHVCEICNKQFTIKGNLDKHRTIHAGDKPFSCDECDKRFRLKSHLDRHTLIHTGEKPFSCNVCKKRFQQKCHVDKHMRIHTGEEPYSCKECKKQFKQKCHLDRHRQLHI